METLLVPNLPALANWFARSWQYIFYAGSLCFWSDL